MCRLRRIQKKFHGVGKFNVADGATKSGNNNSLVFANELCRLAEKDSRIVAVTAAMTSGTGLTEFKKRFPERFLMSVSQSSTGSQCPQAWLQRG